ncbi:MAG TPA: hypothetical protein VIK59_05255 [Verrucomicrobiae bacterium]
METIIFKAPSGTKEKLRALNPNLSDLLRQAAENLVGGGVKNSAHERAKHLIFSGGGKMSRGNEYLKIYAKKKPR